MSNQEIALSEIVEAQVVRDLWTNVPTEAVQKIGYSDRMRRYGNQRRRT